MTHAQERAVVVHPDGDAVGVHHHDGDAVARATAARLLLALLDAQAVRRPLHVALTGGTVGTKTLVEVAASPLRDLVDWSGVHLWWGDERYVAADNEDRNEGQARKALIDALDVPEQNVHPFPADDGGTSLDQAAAAFAEVLAHYRSDDQSPDVWPVFDVTLLGVGPDGHVASLFPGKETLGVTDRSVVAEPDSPKPPPARLSLTLPVLNASRQVWLVVAGEDKRDAVAAALQNGSDLPAAQVHGQDVTLWLLDAAAAGLDQA